MIVFSTEIKPSTMARCRGPFPSISVFTCTIIIHTVYIFLCMIIHYTFYNTCTCATCHGLIKYHRISQNTTVSQVGTHGRLNMHYNLSFQHAWALTMYPGLDRNCLHLYRSSYIWSLEMWYMGTNLPGILWYTPVFCTLTLARTGEGACS